VCPTCRRDGFVGQGKPFCPTYDLFSDVAVEESDEEKPGVILDFDKNGNVVGLEILDASKRMENPRSVEYAVAG